MSELAKLVNNESFWKTFKDPEITSSSVGIAIMRANLANLMGETVDERTQRILDKAEKLMEIDYDER